MGRTATSVKRKRYSLASMQRHNPFTKELRNPKLVKAVLIEALMENDLDTFQDVLIAHLRSMSKRALALRTGLGRQTIYDLTSKQKRFNPTLETLGIILNKLAA